MKLITMSEMSEPRDKRLRRSGGEPAASGEAGFVLLAVIFMMALLVLSLAVAMPKVTAAIQRDRELEMVHRGEQYKRAIRLYYKKFGSYPGSIDQLEKTNNIRFLRKRYLDPLTGKDDWKLILVNQAHVCPLGFFGQPLGAGTTLAGATSAASLAGTGTTLGGGYGSGGFGSSSSSGFGSGSSSGFGSSGNSGFGSSGSSSSGFGSSSSSSSGTGPTSSGTGCGVAGAGSPSTSSGDTASSTTTGASTGGSTSTDTSSGGSSGFGSAASSGSGMNIGGSTSTSTTLGGGNASSTGFGASTSTTLGGTPFMGVMPPTNKATILAYKLKSHYNEWEFAYWPVEEQTAAPGLMGGSGSVSSSSTSSVGAGGSSGPGGFGSSSSGSGFGSGTGSGFGSGSGGAFGSAGGLGGNSGGGGQAGTPPP